LPAISAQSMDPEVAPIGKLNRCFFGTGRRMHDIHLMLRRISCSEAPVLIQGETGSGKEVLAREIHAHSLRANRPFLKLNCAALPAELVESELFGYEKGAFTGAFQRKAGMFEVADGGTILLDEIGDMDLKLQAKLLQVLQDKEFPRLGGKEMIRVDIRIMAATHRDLEQAIPENTFREDLYYRLNVINIELPPLRERADDIPALADYFIQKYSENQPVPVIGPKLGDALVAYDWPGNIRELENVMRRFLILRDEESLTQELIAKTAKRRRIVANREVAAAAQAQAVAAPALAEPARPPVKILASSAALGETAAAPADLSVNFTVLQQVAKAKANAEADAIRQALEATRWNRKQAAQVLQIDYKALLYKMKKLSVA
jgi:transcriptional regulator with PAS, ATPase and Fis domain